ncbi:MAG: FAD-binding oxidoreductase [Oricola sp.]
MTIETLRKTVRGTVTARPDAGYEAVRRGLTWNGRKPERFPEIVVKAKDAADVQAAVKFAAATGRRVSPRGGGHQFSGIAVQDGIVIDLSAMNALSIEIGAHIARAQPTVTNGALVSALGDLGLAFPAGHCASVPLSGYLLGGGVGWNAGAWGIACHNLESVEVVLADGSLVEASETENPDIFWAVRGGGPEFFGVVTEYRLRLFELPKAIRTSVWTYPIDAIDAVERWMSTTMKIAPRNLEFTAAMTPGQPGLAGAAKGTVAAVATIFADTQAEAEAIRTMIQAGAPENALDVQLDMETPFEVLYVIMAQYFREGRRYAVDTNWSANAPGMMRRLAQAIEDAPSPESFALSVILPTPDGTAMPDTAFSMAAPAFSATYAIWQDEARDAANIGWMREASAALAPVTLGHYVGEADLALPGRLAACYAPAALERLRQLQRKYDPNGVFQRHAPEGEALRKAG